MKWLSKGSNHRSGRGSTTAVDGFAYVATAEAGQYQSGRAVVGSPSNTDSLPGDQAKEIVFQVLPSGSVTFARLKLEYSYVHVRVPSVARLTNGPPS